MRLREATHQTRCTLGPGAAIRNVICFDDLAINWPGWLLIATLAISMAILDRWQTVFLFEISYEVTLVTDSDQW